MSSPDELALLEDDDLFEFLLQESWFVPDVSVRNNFLMDNWGLPEPEPLDKELDDFITSILNPFQNGTNTQQDYLPADEDISVPEDQLQLLNFVNELGFSDFSFNDFSFNDFSFNDFSFNDSSFNDFSFNDFSFNDFSFDDFSFDDFSFDDFSFDDFSFDDFSFDDFSFDDFSSDDFSFNDFPFNDFPFNDFPFSNFSFSEVAGSEVAGSNIAGSDFAGSNFAGTDPASDSQNLEFMQVDHNYPFHWDWSMLQSIASELAGMSEDMFVDANDGQRAEGTSMALAPTSDLPFPAPADATPQAEFAITAQANFPELVLSEEEKQLQVAEDFTYLPPTQVKDQLVKKVRRKSRSRRSARNVYRRKKRNMNNQEHK